MARVSFLISPPCPTRRSPTGKRSMVEMPSVPVRSADQKVSRSWPIGVTTPAAVTAMRSACGNGQGPDVEEVGHVGSEEGGEEHAEGADQARLRVVDAGGEEAAIRPIEGDPPRRGWLVGIVDEELEKAPVVDAVVVGDHGVVQLDLGQVGDEELHRITPVELGKR